MANPDDAQPLSLSRSTRIEIWRTEVARSALQCSCPSTPSTTSSGSTTSGSDDSATVPCPACTSIGTPPEIVFDNGPRLKVAWHGVRNFARRVGGRKATQPLPFDESEGRLTTQMYRIRGDPRVQAEGEADGADEASSKSGPDVNRAIKQKQARLDRAERLLGRIGQG